MQKVAMEIHVPKWVKEEKGEIDIIQSILFEASAKMEYYRSKILIYEKKYKMSYEKFEEKIKKDKKENFEQWDDFIIWEGFHQVYCEWKERYEDLKECMK